MIREEIVSKRYADAFLEFAKESIGFDRGLEELSKVKRIIRDNPDLQEFLEHFEITNTEKGDVIDAVFVDSFADETRYFLKLLVEKKRMYLFTDIAEFARINYAHGTELDALVKTSYPLETETIHRIKNALQTRMNRKIHMYVELDPDLEGGAYARIGNIIIDGSVKRRLEDMRDKLKTLKVV